MAHASELLYSDHYLILRTGTLTIHKYYFPTASPRNLQTSRIESVFPATALNLTWWEFKVWGILPTWIYWTLDWHRGKLHIQGKIDEILKRSVIIKTSQGFFHNVGVTCDNIPRFLEEMERLGVKVIREPVERHSHSE
jgi:hypothetical protein